MDSKKMRKRMVAGMVLVMVCLNTYGSHVGTGSVAEAIDCEGKEFQAVSKELPMVPQGLLTAPKGRLTDSWELSAAMKVGKTANASATGKAKGAKAANASATGKAKGAKAANASATGKAKGKKAVLLPDAAPMNFVLFDGSEDWQMALVVKNRQGSFHGVYSTDRTGKKVRISRFHGRFSKIRKINSYTYRMTLGKLSLQKQPGEEWVEQGTHYVACEPLGLKKGMAYQLYTSEMPMKKFYKSVPVSELEKWFPDYSAKKKHKGLLSRFVLTNTGMDGAFLTSRVLMEKDIEDIKRRKSGGLSRPSGGKKPIKNEMLPARFFFTQSGGWRGTVLSITGENGSFSGTYARSKRHRASKCKFSGKFGKIKKLNPYTYSMTVKKLKLTRAAGGRSNKSLPYGLKKGEQFLLYLPNTPLDAMKKKFEDYLSWVPYYEIPENKSAGLLSCYGLYNKNMGYGWWL